MCVGDGQGISDGYCPARHRVACFLWECGLRVQEIRPMADVLIAVNEHSTSPKRAMIAGMCFLLRHAVEPELTAQKELCLHKEEVPEGKCVSLRKGTEGNAAGETIP